MQGNGENLPVSERIEEVRENADGEIEAVLRQTTSVDDEGRSATVNEVHQYVTREEMERYTEQAVLKHMDRIVQQAVDQLREELMQHMKQYMEHNKEQMAEVIDTQDLCVKTIETLAAKFQEVVGVIADVQRNQQMMQALYQKLAEALDKLAHKIAENFEKLPPLINGRLAPIESRLTVMNDNFNIINTNFTSMGSTMTGLQGMLTTFQNTFAKLDDMVQRLHAMQGAQSAMQQPDVQQPDVQQPVQQPVQQQSDVQQPQQPEQRRMRHSNTKAGLELDWMEGLTSTPLQDLHVSAGLKRKIYKEKIKPMPGFSVLVADIMREGPKHHPTVFKENMRFDEAEDILAIACGGPKVGRKKIKLLRAEYDDGTPVYSSGIQGYMLVPNPDIDDTSNMSGSNENEDAGAEAAAFDHSMYNALPIGPGSEQEGGSHSQNAAELLLNFAHSENEMVPA